ncbi:MAG: hypothetical protein HOA57_00755 [Candidatus Magasanikbacteria bacterium]|jgi:hypothetical protein|nr:hypothetical protein [Candidatus Magasanikbacteria bacterium]MBT4314603.1 hypothetical protein [Candidatus Magasanikbacteria bacterium]MBT4546969.1 hypothetical protein [Candidatus Magasanikbacteria bacterium]MBT6818902.1 hypothetical protein [Candidatus Magasanikbacteria bacterium]
MPYILQSDRERLDPKIKELAETINTDQRAGELNYTITKLLLALKGNGKYKDYNELMGALESAKLEFYRREIAPYEDTKIEENGDVY